MNPRHGKWQPVDGRASDLRSVNAQIEFLLRDAVNKRKGGKEA
jgi:hypothetical protein